MSAAPFANIPVAELTTPQAEAELALMRRRKTEGA